MRIKSILIFLLIIINLSCDKSSNEFESPCEDISGIDFGPCLAIIGYGWDGSKCRSISGCSTVDTNGSLHKTYRSLQSCQNRCEK